MAETILTTDALLVIDMQYDFLPGGALGVSGGDEIVAGIHALAGRFEHVVLTQDWHPQGHISFSSAHAGKQAFTDTVEAAYGTQTLWPDHCVQGTSGAELAVTLPQAELILRKGFRTGIDSYSAFLENDKTTPTGLKGYLQERGITRVFLCGLAYDFCVGNSAVDAAGVGFEVVVVDDLTRAVGLPGTVESMRSRLDQAGVRSVTSSEL